MLRTRTRRLLLVALEDRTTPASISGRVTDVNPPPYALGTGFAGATVFLDLNADGSSTGEPTATTDFNGNYTFNGLAAGSYAVRVAAGSGCSVPAGTTNPQSVTLATANTGTGGVNFAVQSKQGGASGRVYDDANANNSFDTGETLIAGATVYDDANGNGQRDAGEAFATTTSSGTSNRNYTLTNLVAGARTLRYELPNGYAVLGNPAGTVTVADGTTVTTAPSFRAQATATGSGAINGRAFVDVNGSGVPDAGDTFLGSVTVFYDADANGSLTAGDVSTTTDAQGNYSLTVPAGSNRAVRAIAPAGYSLVGNPPAGAVVPANGSATVNFRLGTAPGSVSGSVYFDMNADGQYSKSPDVLMPGTVVYYDADNSGTLSAGDVSTTANNSGIYTLAVPAGSGRAIRVTPPAGYVAAVTQPVLVTVASGQASTADFALAAAGGATGTASGFVYLDSNANGSRDAGDAVMANITVYYDANTNGAFDSGEVSTTTDAKGAYSFALPSGMARMIRAIDPAGNVLAGGPRLANIAPNLTTTADLRYLPAASTGTVGGRVYVDANGNGSFDSAAGDQPLAGATVFLDLDADGLLGANDPHATTDASGNYSISAAPGSNRPTRLVVPAGYLTIAGNPIYANIGAGLNTAIDFRLQTASSATATVSGRAFIDANANGSFDSGDTPLANLTIYLDGNANGSFDGGELGVATATDGTYALTVPANSDRPIRTAGPAGYTALTAQPTIVNIPPNGTLTLNERFAVAPTSGTVAGLVFTDLNGNGQYDKGSESLLPGVVVYYDANKSGSLDAGDVSATVNSNGQYSLSVPSGAGRIVSQTAGPFTASLNVLAGGTITLDMPVMPTDVGTLAGTVFFDANRNGQRDGGEPGQSNAIAFLDVNNNGALDAGERSTSTGPDGAYRFSVPAGGTYRVRVLAAPGSSVLVQPADVAVTGGKTATVPTVAATPPALTHLRPIVAAADAGGAPAVMVYNPDGSLRYSYFAYSQAFTGGVRVAVGDVNGDGVWDIITTPGVGGGPHVRVIDGETRAEIASFYAYAPNFTGGVTLAVGDIDGDGKADIVTGTGPGGGPHLRAFSGANLAGPLLYDNYAYAPNFLGGINVAVGDVNGDGKGDIITGVGAGGGPHVRVFNGANPNGPLLTEFYAYAPQFTGGVRVAAGDIDGDGRAEIVTTPGPGGGPHVQAFHFTASGGLTTMLSYYAYAPTFSGGVRVATGDVTGDGRAEIFVVPGVTAGAPAGSYKLRWFTGTSSDPFRELDPFPGFLGGAYVG